MKNLILCFFLLLVAYSLPDQQLVTAPGMLNQIVYSGYLKTKVSGRQIHYVFIKSQANFQTSPLAIWLNGGPGCSSLIGMLQQVGPCLAGNHYQQGDLLKDNPHSWNKAAHLLFLQSPAIVGFSTDTDYTFHYTDTQTGDDAFEAVRYFLFEKAPQLRPHNLYITGESYAGKYIPDISVRIMDFNTGKSGEELINLKGVLIGNGVMDFRQYSIERSEIQYMYQHDFIDQRLWSIYRSSCHRDFESPRCQYFQLELEKYDQATLNPYYVYEVCKTDQGSEGSRLIKGLSQINTRKTKKRNKQIPITFDIPSLNEIPVCPSDLGTIRYLNVNKVAFHVENSSKFWSPCNEINYTIGDHGSMLEYERMLAAGGVKIWLYNGDWDDIVPYRDTQKNLEKLKLPKVGNWQPWYYDSHHAGFYQDYEKLMVITVKGASHMVPATKPAQAYQIFYNFINNHPVNTPVQ